MIALISSNNTYHRIPTIRTKWLDRISIPYVIITGNPLLDTEYQYNAETHECILKCDDSYEGLPDKMSKAFKFIKEKFDPAFLFKVDDDVIIDVDKLNAFLHLNITAEYVGTTVSGYEYKYCGGPMYRLGPNALECLSKHFHFTHTKAEDYSVGCTLKIYANIDPIHIQLYTDNYQHFIRNISIAFHDTTRILVNKDKDGYIKSKLPEPQYSPNHPLMQRRRHIPKFSNILNQKR